MDTKIIVTQRQLGVRTALVTFDVEIRTHHLAPIVCANFGARSDAEYYAKALFSTLKNYPLTLKTCSHDGAKEKELEPWPV